MNVMVAVSGLVAMISMADIDGGQYVDVSDENLISVTVTMAAVVAVAWA